jgi:hypothetical protein
VSATFYVATGNSKIWVSKMVHTWLSDQIPWKKKFPAKIYPNVCIIAF